MHLPSSARYVIVGAGIHGLSTAYHLARELKARGKGSGQDIHLIEKSDLCAGATGIACGVIRNNYFQPAMRELMAHSVNVWESDREAYSYHPVGYMQISSESMHEDVASIYQQQKAIGYDSTFVEGEADCAVYMKNIFHDWRAQNITSVLHEKRGGYANNSLAMEGVAAKARAEGVSIHTGVELTGFERDASGAVSAVQTSRGTIGTEYVVLCVGPWMPQAWNMLELPENIDILNADTGETARDVPMWIYWSLQEGTLGVDPKLQVTNDGALPPVIHVDTDAPLYCDRDGELITDQMWGIYYKPDFHFGGIQGGASPYKVDTPVNEVQIDPYGPSSPEFVASDEFAHMWVSALAHCQARYEGTMPKYHREASGGIGCFTADSFPVFDHFHENATIIADSNHGWKMLGVGHLIADEVLGTTQELLEPFRFDRFAKGELHPVSNSPYPWS